MYWIFWIPYTSVPPCDSSIMLHLLHLASEHGSNILDNEKSGFSKLSLVLAWHCNCFVWMKLHKSGKLPSDLHVPNPVQEYNDKNKNVKINLLKQNKRYLSLVHIKRRNMKKDKEIMLKVIKNCFWKSK